MNIHVKCFIKYLVHNKHDINIYDDDDGDDNKMSV